MKIMLFIILSVMSMSGFAQQHLIKTESRFSVSETADRLEGLIKEKGLTFFARIDHAANAKGVDLELNPTQLILFGNPKVGTLLMQCQATMAIDLPQKALIWQDHESKVWLAFNNPEHLKELHEVQECDEVFEKIKGLLNALLQAATQ